jgi:hypothetical protein
MRQELDDLKVHLERETGEYRQLLEARVQTARGKRTRRKD